MAGTELRQVGDMVMVPVAIWQRVDSLLSEQESLRQRLDALEAISVTGSEFLSRQQAMEFLHVGSTKLWELSRSGAIATTSKTGKPLFLTSSCKEYLNGQGFSAKDVQARFQDILRNKKKK